jgi:predicted transcriptional regulator
MIKKYTKGSKIHLALNRLHICQANRKDLSKLIGFSESLGRFEESIIKPLLIDGFVYEHNDNFYLTEGGLDKLEELGHIKERLPSVRISKFEGTYVPAKYLNPISRVGAEDHEKYPSRAGNSLRYRDGRVVML